MGPIEKVLRGAADRLWDGVTLGATDKQEYICHAIADEQGLEHCTNGGTPAVQFLCELGMQMSGSGFLYTRDAYGAVMHRFSPVSEEQGVRYAFLQLAIQVAKEEGL